MADLTSWRERAACRGVSREVFITAGDADDDPYFPSDEALSYCDRCPVRPECLSFAIERDVDGVWGGTTAYQRRQLARTRSRAHCPGCGSTDVTTQTTVELCLACGASWYVL